MYILDGQPLSPDMPFEHAGISYPANWIRLSTPAERAAIGITEVVVPPKPDEFYNLVLADPVNHGQWIVTPYTAEEMKPRLMQYSREARDIRINAGVSVTIGADTYTVPTDQQTRDRFFDYRIIQERPGTPISTVVELDSKAVQLTEAQLLSVEQKMEARVKGCYDTQLSLQTTINAGTTTTKEQINAAYTAVP